MFFPHFKLWFFLFNLLNKRYSIKIASTLQEREAVFKFRHQIYVNELGYTFLCEDNQKDMLFDEYDFMPNSVIIYSGDVNHITGTIRMTVWDRENFPLKKEEEYLINKNLLAHFVNAGEINFFQVRKENRKGFLGLALISFLYKVALDPRFNHDIVFLHCFPGLIEQYFTTGGFIYTSQAVLNAYGTLLIPMAIAPFDFNFLKENKCITYGIAKDCLSLFKNKVSDEVYKTKCQNLSAIFPHISIYFKRHDIAIYRSNIDDQDIKKQFDFLISLIQKGIVIYIKKNTAIIKSNLIDYDIFLLMEGKVGVFFENVLIAEIKPGMLFGEMAQLHPHHKRQSDVYSLTDVKIMLIPRNLLIKLERKDIKLANKWLHFLCDELIQKLNNTNRLLYEKIKDKGQSK